MRQLGIGIDIGSDAEVKDASSNRPLSVRTLASVSDDGIDETLWHSSYFAGVRLSSIDV